MLFQSEEKTRDPDGSSTDKAELNRDKWIGSADNNKYGAKKDGINCLRQIESADAFDVGDGCASFFYNVGHGCKI